MIYSHILISGSKEAVVNFINRGLKGCNVKSRVSESMSGSEIVNYLNRQRYSISMTSYIPMPRTYFKYDTTNTVKCLSSWYIEGIKPYDMIDSNSADARQKELEDFISSHNDVFSGNFGISDYNLAVEMLHPELKEAYRLYRHNYYQARSYQKRVYGIIGWLDWCRTTYGCTWPAPFDIWKWYRETENSLCLVIEVSFSALIPDVFLRYMNSNDGLTVYAYGYDNEEFEFWYRFNGQTNEIIKKNPWKDRNFRKHLKEFASAAGDDDTSNYEYSAVHKVMRGYVQKFLQELDEFLPKKNKKNQCKNNKNTKR